jgi:hypothetical protein
MKVAFGTGGLLIIATLPPVLQGWQTACLRIPCLQGIAAPSAVPEMLFGVTTASAADLPFELSDTFLLHRAAGIVTAMLIIQVHGYDPFQFSSGGS